jgi:hypothetical protein
MSFLLITLEMATRARKRSEDWKRTSKVREGRYVNIFPLEDIKKMKKVVDPFCGVFSFCLCASGKHGKNGKNGKLHRLFANHSKASIDHVSFLFSTLEIATRARKRSKDWKRTSKV